MSKTSKWTKLCNKAERLAVSLPCPEKPYVIIHKGITAMVVDGGETAPGIFGDDLTPAIVLLPKRTILGVSSSFEATVVLFVRLTLKHAEWYFSDEARKLVKKRDLARLEDIDEEKLIRRR